MFNDKECKGCKGVGNFCALPSLGCPCIECLVKCVCDEHCGEYGQHLTNGLNKIERITQLIYYTGGSFWIQRAYLVDMEALHNAKIEPIVKGDNDESGALADIFEKLSQADIDVGESSGIADINGSYGVILYLEQEDCEKAVAVFEN